MNAGRAIYRPILAAHARYRWDKLRSQHQLVFPEGMVVLNDTGAAILRLCDGRSTDELIAALKEEFRTCEVADDVQEFLHRLTEQGLLRDASAS
jgi:coenzyme PQQ biosynthesis protein PqqD